jgi:large exoprotein involved in heme utilization and adhesion
VTPIATGVVAITGGADIKATAGDGTMGTFGNAGTIDILSDAAIVLAGVDATTAGLVEISSSSFAGAGDAGTITLTGTELTASFAELSTETSSDGGVEASINLLFSSDISLTDSFALASTSGSTNAGSITIEGTTFSMDGGLIESSSTEQGNAGSISIAGPGSTTAVPVATGAVAITGGADIKATAGIEGGTTGTFGNAGTIDVLSDAAIVLAGLDATTAGLTEISSSSFAGAGQAGSITLTGSDLTTSFVELTTETASSTAGTPASINLQFANDVSLTDTRVVATTSGATTAGNVLIDATNINLLNNTVVGAATSGSGNAGNVDLIAGNTISAVTGTLLGARSTGTGNAGSVTLNAGNLISLVGTNVESSSIGAGVGLAGSVSLAAAQLNLMDSSVSTQTASNVTDVPVGVEPGSITLSSSLGIVLDGTLVQASTSGQSSAGTVSLGGDTIDLANDSAVLASTSGAGDAGNVELVAVDSINLPEGMLVAAQSTGPGSAGSVTLQAGNIINITGATVKSSSTSDTGVNVGVAGTVQLDAGEVILTNAFITTETTSNVTAVGDGVAPGSITISSDSGLLLDGTLISTSASGLAAAGNISLNAVTIDLANGAGVLASTSGGGDAGSVELIADDSITLPEGMLVAAQSTGAGNAGSVTLDAGGLISITSATVESSSLGQGVGLAGSVTVTGGDLLLTDALISTRTDSDIAEDQIPDGFAGEPGAITLISDSGVMLDATTIETITTGAADAGDIYVEALDGDIDLVNASTVTAATSGAGDAGDVTLVASGAINLPILTEVSAKSTGPGDAGSVSLFATGDLTIVDATVTSSSDGVGVGTAGNINLSGANITLLNTGELGDPDSDLTNVRVIVSTTSSSDITDPAETDETGEGDVRPGTITISTPGLLYMEQARLSASVSGAADGGDIVIDANDLTLVQGSVIETRATGTGDSGSVTLNIANDLTLVTPEDATLPDNQSAILTNSRASQGGTITANIGGVLFMDRSRIESSVDTADGTGGDILLTTNGLFMVGSQILARADEGNGGAIIINRGERVIDPLTDTPFDGLFIIDSESLINADSNEGVSGEVNIDSPDADLTAVVEVVSARIVDDPTLADDICNPANREAQSSFIVEDKGGVAPSPDGYFSAGVLSDDGTRAVAGTGYGTSGFIPPEIAALGGCR